MYIDTIPNRNSPPAVLVRESYREGGKVKKRTVANISKLPTNVINTIKATLAGKREESDGVLVSSIPIATSGPIFAILAGLNQLSGKLGINKTLGNSRLAQLVKFLIFAGDSF